MTIDLNRRDVLQASLAGAVSIAMPAMAQSNFPSRPIKLICPWPAGGSTDAVMRAIAESASRILNNPVIIENKGGAGGMLGPNELVSAKPDGYTLSQLPMGILRIPHMQKTLFDPLADFTYVACLTGYTFGIVVRSDSPINSNHPLLDNAKANPGKFT
jgi:tripartite-type tricarboxylate transporter receptor subunit TctC